MLKQLVNAMKETEEGIMDLPTEQWADWIVYLVESLDSGSEESNKMIEVVKNTLAFRLENKQW